MVAIAVVSYNDYIRRLLENVDCVVALETAADYLGLSNGGYRPYVQIYVKNTVGIEGVREYVVDDFDKMEYASINGLKCTTENQTIVDLMESNGDEQIITESLANYYDMHGESFAGLSIPEHLLSGFQKYCQWAMEYYEE